MPTPKNLEPLEILFSRGYWPSAPDIPPAEFVGTIRRGSNVWLRSTGRPEVAKGLNQVSATNVGARIFAANTKRATLAGGLVGSLLPYAGLIRFDNDVLLFLSEVADAQLYLDEVAVSGVTASPTAGRLRVAVPNSGGGYDDFDAGFDAPVLGTGAASVNLDATNPPGLALNPGILGAAVARWRTKTNAISAPSNVIFNTVSADFRTISITLPSAASGQDGWIFGGTRWADQSGELHVVRYVYISPPGTFTATNGSPNLTAGVGTRWLRDLRERDQITIGAEGTYTVSAITSNTTLTLTGNFTGSTNSGKVITNMPFVNANWYDSDLGALLSRDVFKPPRAAGVLKYAGRVLLFGVPDTLNVGSTSPTGNAVVALLLNNPEHVGVLAIGTASGSDIVNALGADGPLYLMTTTGLEIVSFTSDPDEPYKIKEIAAPGFAAATNGVLDGDYFYGFNGAPFRTKADKNIDFEFAEPVHKIMKLWDARRVMLNTDPINKAVLYMHDDGAASVVIPWMTQLGCWGPELNFSARIIDSQVVNGKLYLTYLSGGNYRVQQWEGGAGIGGTRFVASQYIDPRLLATNRVKRLAFTGKAGTLRVYAAPETGAVPDVSNTGAADVSFALSDTDISEPEIGTNVGGKAFAFRVDFPSDDGHMNKLVVAGTPIGR